jgi:hypothetical protein
MQRKSSEKLCCELNLSAEARELASENCRGSELFCRLREARLYPDALRLLPHLLPKRRAVWWGCLCVWHAHKDRLSSEAAQALEATIRWIHSPDEAHRRACEAAAQAAELQNSAGCVAMAAFWSSGSMSRPELPAVAAPPALCAKLIAGAVLLAAAEYQPHRLEEHYEQFLMLGEQVARGQLPWSLRRRPEAADLGALRLDAFNPVQPPHWLHSSVVATVSRQAAHPEHRRVEIKP